MFKVTISGHLTKDVEVIASQTGKPYLRLNVAVNYYSTKDGKQVVFCTVFKFATDAYISNIANLLIKGTPVVVMGSASVSVYNDKPQLTIQADDLDFFAKPKADNSQADNNYQPTQGQGRQVQKAQAQAEMFYPQDANFPSDDDIPF